MFYKKGVKMLFGKYNHNKTNNEYMAYAFAFNRDKQKLVLYGRAGKYFVREIDEFKQKFTFKSECDTIMLNIPATVINATNACDGQVMDLAIYNGNLYVMNNI